MSLAGYIATPPSISYTRKGDARMHTRVGVEHYRKEVDGTYTPLEPTYHDLVLFGPVAEKAYDQFQPGDCFIASGHIHEFEDSKVEGLIREEFVARKIGHDAARSTYEVQRRNLDTAAEPSTATAAAPAIGA
jgi:hypothetical protein